ncbi:MAG TPA: hypothetical protein VGC67_04085 [Cellulomonas sp.]
MGDLQVDPDGLARLVGQVHEVRSRPEGAPEPSSAPGYRDRAPERLEERGIERRRVEDVAESPAAEAARRPDEQPWLHEGDDRSVVVDQLGEGHRDRDEREDAARSPMFAAPAACCRALRDPGTP